MIAWVNDAEHFFHPLLKGIVIHFLYGYLDPHMDGNGQMARLLFYWFVLKSDYWIFEYLPISSIILQSRAGYRDSFLMVESDLHDLVRREILETKKLGKKFLYNLRSEKKFPEYRG